MRFSIIIILFISLSFTMNAATKIKFATVATEGSTWMKVMNQLAKAVEDSTNGEVKFKIYPGAVQGDEKDVLRKMRIGQVHSAGFTGVGLGEILPEVRIMDAPFLFNTYDEVDYVSDKLSDHFSQKFEEKGYILLGWAEVGFVYVFTNTPVNDIKDMSGVKMWMWEGDPIAEAAFTAMNISPIPLSLTDVLTSLQTSLINGVYISPLACTALQWHTKVKYMLELPLADSNGAVLITKKQFSRLTPEQQNILKYFSSKYLRQLTRLSREDNATSLELMKKAGIQFTKITDENQLKSFTEAGKKARQSLVGKLFDQEFLTQVENYVLDFRNSK